MATLLTNQTASSAVSRSPKILTTGTGSCSINENEFFFISNSPEEVQKIDLADNKKFLNRANIKGNGQIYTWHGNRAGQTIKNCLLFYNPNNYDVTVKVTNYGLTDLSVDYYSDSNAWADYYNGLNTSITVPAGGYANLFLRSIANGHNFGIIARANVVRKNTTTAAQVTLFDLAYDVDSGNATMWADPDPAKDLRMRGIAKGFYTTITFPTVSPSDTQNGVGYKYAANDGFFKGNDLAYVYDYSNTGITGPLQGAFGQQYSITIPIHNATGSARSFRIFIGSRGGTSFPFVNFNGSTLKLSAAGIPSFDYLDVIETDTIANGATKSYTFSTVIPAMSDAPYFVGVRLAK